MRFPRFLCRTICGEFSRLHTSCLTRTFLSYTHTCILNRIHIHVYVFYTSFPPARTQLISLVGVISMLPIEEDSTNNN